MSLLHTIVGMAVAGVLCVTTVASGAAVPVAIQLPGAPAFDVDLQDRLWRAWGAEPEGFRPNTSHVNADGSPKYVNRLVFASSPYLQQHAFNPVNWYSWGAEAFAAAARDDKPIFLSIGYSTCHWCHVMERECFDNETIARALNERFVAIKVDREERPDIDSVYVAAVERMTGSAGWPLTVFLTPDGKPFYGGTYFPPADQAGRPGLPKLLATVADVWKTKRERVLSASADLTKSLQEASNAEAVDLSDRTLRAAYEAMAESYDAEHGGFGHAPKFPQAHMLTLLLHYWHRTGAPQALRMVTETLDHMARGGIHDQLGGGFHRYAIDATWLLPHFEKMLYDQAMDARAYLEAYQAAGDPRHAEVARDTLAYVLRDMTAPEGGFYSAEDADSDGEEGRFYLWSRAEMIAALGTKQGALAADFFGLHDQSARKPLSVPATIDDFGRRHGMDRAGVEQAVGRARDTLLALRNRRTRPARDDKIITAWNGLMISTLAYASTVLGEPHYAAAAARAAEFVLGHMQRDGRLARSSRHGVVSPPGYLDDSAFFIAGLEDLYAATFDVRWLREADRLTRQMLNQFGDSATGALRYGSGDDQLIAGGDAPEDAALPSAQSMAALVLLRLGRLTMNTEFEGRGRAVLAAYSHDIERAPTAHTQFLIALDFALGPTKEIVIAGPAAAPGTRALLAEVRHRYLPRALLALHRAGDADIEHLVPFLKRQTMLHDKPTAYVCENYVCKLPTTDVGQLRKLLGAAAAAALDKQPAPGGTASGTGGAG